jgi:hypothetical protein
MAFDYSGALSGFTQLGTAYLNQSTVKKKAKAAVKLAAAEAASAQAQARIAEADALSAAAFSGGAAPAPAPVVSMPLLIGGVALLAVALVLRR